MAELAVTTTKAQTANGDMLDAIGRAFPLIDEPLKRIAMLNSMLATTDRLQLEGVAFEGFEEMLHDIEDCLVQAGYALLPAFDRWKEERAGRSGRPVTGAD
ncbi:MAG: hypothetical protein K6E40_09120 [Desulfovibrio sp.]|nr:hypothetical protein [Desulfovibrio sp.]